jgi:hypothetical protein
MSYSAKWHKNDEKYIGNYMEEVFLNFFKI